MRDAGLSAKDLGARPGSSRLRPRRRPRAPHPRRRRGRRAQDRRRRPRDRRAAPAHRPGRPLRPGPLKLLDTLARTNGISYLMDFIYYSSVHQRLRHLRHFLRAAAQLTNCLEYETIPFPGCEAFFPRGQRRQHQVRSSHRRKRSNRRWRQLGRRLDADDPGAGRPAAAGGRDHPGAGGPLDGDAEQAEPAQPAEPGAGGDSGEGSTAGPRPAGSPPGTPAAASRSALRRRRGRVRSPDHGGRLALLQFLLGGAS